MKQRTIENEQQLHRAVQDLMNLRGHLPVVISVTEGRSIRSEGQNKRYWSELTEFLNAIDETVEQVAEHTGHTQLEVKRFVAEQLPIEQAAILFVRTPEAAHDVMKAICNIPTSTRLGTKAFMKFEDTLSATMMEILGTVNAVKQEALG